MTIGQVAISFKYLLRIVLIVLMILCSIPGIEPGSEAKQVLLTLIRVVEKRQIVGLLEFAARPVSAVVDLRSFLRFWGRSLGSFPAGPAQIKKFIQLL
jgi:hypothetical protein